MTGVTKAMLGSAEIAATLIEAGVKRLGDSRIENIKSMRIGQQFRQPAVTTTSWSSTTTISRSAQK